MAPVTVTGTGVFTIRVPKTDANASREMYFRDRVTAPGLEFKYPSGGGDDVTQIVLPSTAALPTNLYLSGAVCVSLEGDRGLWNPKTVSVRSGAKLDLPTGAAVATTSGNWQFDGGTLGVSGGTFAATNRTNSCGRFYVRGNNVHTGRVDVTGGWWRYTVKSWSGGSCALNDCGEIRCTAGELQLRRLSNSDDVVKSYGGRILVSDKGVLYRNGDASMSSGLDTGDVSFTDNSEMKMRTSNRDSFFVCPAYGGTARVVWKDNFDFTDGYKWDGKLQAFDTVHITSRKTGHGILEIDSNLESFSTPLGSRLSIGGEPSDGNYPGFGELIVKKGTVTAGYRGVQVGSVVSDSGRKNNRYPGGRGILRVQGGTVNAGTVTAISKESVFTGFTIGEAGQTHAHGKHLFRGEVYLSGGKIAQAGFMVVGGARGEGLVEQTGGTLSTCYWGSYPVFIGLFGGTGSYTLGGGSFTSHKPIYIGGSDKTNVANYAYLATNYPNYPFDDPMAEGLLSITGGTFVVDNTASVWVGCRGKGIFSVTGTRATKIQLYNGKLILSNNTVTVNGVTTKTSSTLRFILDETAKGVTPIDVNSDGTTGGKVVNTDGTRVEVALGETRRTKNCVQLMKFNEWEGPVPELVATGVDARYASLDLQSTALYLRLKRGLVVIVK